MFFLFWVGKVKWTDIISILYTHLFMVIVYFINSEDTWVFQEVTFDIPEGLSLAGPAIFLKPFQNIFTFVHILQTYKILISVIITIASLSYLWKKLQLKN